MWHAKNSRNIPSRILDVVLELSKIGRDRNFELGVTRCHLAALRREEYGRSLIPTSRVFQFLPSGPKIALSRSIPHTTEFVGRRIVENLRFPQSPFPQTVLQTSQ